MALRYGKTFVAEEDYPIVETKAGKYLGYIDDEVFTFKGMEYAYADRFHMPEAPRPFEGVREAYNYGYGVPEMTYDLRGKKPGDEIEQIGMYWNMDEHLQHVNVWTKSIDPDAKRPVIFFIVSNTAELRASPAVVIHRRFERSYFERSSLIKKR